MLEGMDDSDVEWNQSEESDVEDAADLSARSTLRYPELREAKCADAPHIYVLNSSWIASGKCELERLDHSMITMNGTVSSMFHECDGMACSGSWCDTYLVVTPELLNFFRETHRRCRQLERPAKSNQTAAPPRSGCVHKKALMIATDALFDRKEDFTDNEYLAASNSLKRAFDAL